jgi:hypothetical protein
LQHLYARKSACMAQAALTRLMAIGRKKRSGFASRSSTCIRPHTSAHVCIRQHTSAYVSARVCIRQHTSAHSVCIRQRTSAHSIQHTSAYVSGARPFHRRASELRPFARLESPPTALLMLRDLPRDLPRDFPRDLQRRFG